MLLDPDGFYDGLLAWLGKLADTEFVRRPALEVVTVVGSIPAAFDAVETLLTGPPTGPVA